MIPYIGTFFISIVCAWISNNKFKNNKKGQGVFFGMLAVIFPSLLASFRVEGIGTDTLYYVKNNFYYACISKTFNQFNTFFTLEFLYNVLVFIISRFTTNIHVLYFFLQFIIMLFVYMACYNEKDKCPIWLSYLCFILLYYNRSLNMVRQSIALALILFGFKYIKEKKLLKYLFICLIASLFHKTAFLGILVYFLYHLCISRNSVFYKIIILSFSLVFLFGYQELMLVLIESNIISSRYLFYVVDSESTILMIELFRKIIFVLILLFSSKKLKEYDYKNRAFVYFLILDVIIYMVGIYANYAQRISYYLGYFDIFVFSQLPFIFKNKKSSIFITFLIIISLLLYWYIYYCVLGYDATYPFVSIFNWK